MNSQKRLSAGLLLVFLCNMILPAASAKADMLVPEGWTRYTNDVCGFTVYLPNESIFQTEFETDVYLRVGLPILDNESNLSDKFVDIECSFDPESRQVSASQITGTTEKVFNQINFLVQSGAEGAAGSLYQAVRYSAEQDGKYATLEFVLRSGQMYDPPRPEFNFDVESAIFEEIMNTFTWGTIPPTPELQLPVTPSLTPIPPTPVLLLPVTPSLTVPITPTITPSEQPCLYSDLFETKRGIINYLEEPPLSLLDGNSLVPFPFTGERRGYDESRARSVIKMLEVECDYYQNGGLNPDQMRAFEARISAFNRLTYTEMGLQGLVPPMAQLLYDFSDYAVESITIGMELIFSITGLADLVEELVPIFAGPIEKIKSKAIYWVLDSIQKIVDMYLDPNNPQQKSFKDGWELVMNIVKVSFDEGSTFSEVVMDMGIKRGFAEFLISAMFEGNSQINTAAESVYPEFAILPILAVKGTDPEAYSAIQAVITADSERAKESHQRAEVAGNSAEIIQITTDFSELVNEAAGLDPSAFLDGLSEKIENFTNLLGVFSQWLAGYASIDAGYNMGVILDRMLILDKIAFDPNGTIGQPIPYQHQPSQLAGINLLTPDRNQIPAYAYYSANGQQFHSSIDHYEQKVQEVLFALETGTDEQVITAIDNLVAADNEVARMIRVAEKPVLGNYSTYPEVKAFIDASQAFSTSNVGFQVALMISLAERTNPEVRQQVSGSAQTIIERSDNLQSQYSLLEQSGLDFSITPSVIISNYEFPAEIAPGTPVLMKVTVTNPGTLSFTGKVSIRGGEILQGSESPSGEITSGQDKVFDVTLQALQAGNEIIFIDLIQDGQTVDSMPVFIQVEQPAFSLPPVGYLVVGGTSLLCLLGLVFGGFILYSTRKTPTRTAPLKKVSKSQRTSLSQSAAQIKQALDLARGKKFEEAFDILKSVVQSEPDNYQAWFNLGLMLANMGNFSDAEKCLLQARKLGHPKADEAMNWLKEKRR